MTRQNIIILLCFASNSLLGQSITSAKKSNIQFHSGLDLRAGFINVLNFDPVIKANPAIPFIGEKNIQGLGLNLGLETMLFRDLYFMYKARLRYDYIKSNSAFPTGSNNGSGSSFVGTELQDSKAFLIDHSLRVLIDPKFRRVNRVGLGYSIINTNKIISEPPQEYIIDDVTYVVEGFNQSIQFETLDVFFWLTTYKALSITTTFHYILKGHPTDPNKNFLSFSLGAVYSIPLSVCSVELDNG